MANRTVKDAHSVKGTNPQYLIEKIIRTRIYECRYWKEECFALTAELLVDKAMELRYIGGIYSGNIKPTPFLCLILKMLQIQPEKDIIVEFIRNEDFKYVRALGAIYMRLTGNSMDCYKYLEPLYLDYRKLKRQDKEGNFDLIHVDEFIDELLREERSCDIILPRIQKRSALEESNQLELRVSALDEDLEDMETSDEEEVVEEPKESPEKKRGSYKDIDKPTRSPSPRHKRSPSPHHRDRGRKRSRSKERDRERKSDKRHRDSDRKHSHRSKHEHKDKDDRHKDRHRDRHRNHGSRHDKNVSKEELEIQEANELRAKLGIAPLKR